MKNILPPLLLILFLVTLSGCSGTDGSTIQQTVSAPVTSVPAAEITAEPTSAQVEPTVPAVEPSATEVSVSTEETTTPRKTWQNFVAAAGLGNAASVTIEALVEESADETADALTTTIDNPVLLAEFVAAFNGEMIPVGTEDCVPEYLLQFDFEDGQPLYLGYLCDERSLISTEGFKGWEGVFLAPDTMLRLLGGLMVQESEAVVVKNGLDLVETAGLSSTARVEVRRFVFGEDGEADQGDFVGLEMVAGTRDPVLIDNLIAGFSQALALEADANCNTAYVITFEDEDGTLTLFDYGCNEPGPQYISGMQPFWQGNSAAAPVLMSDAINELLALTLEEEQLTFEVSESTSPVDPLEPLEIPGKWEQLNNKLFGYTIRYPKTADLIQTGVQMVPDEEPPEDMSADQYFTKLQKKYKNKLCITVRTEMGYVAISAPVNLHNRYVVCTQDILEDGGEDKSEQVRIGDRLYTASGMEYSGNSDALNQHYEVMHIVLEDGTVIEYGALAEPSLTFEQYLTGDKQDLLKVIASFTRLPEGSS